MVREDPANENVLYVGTDRGVYVSLDRGARWTALPAGLPSAPVHDLVVHPREKELVAGTHGRSVWVIDIEPVQLLTEEFAAEALHVYSIDEVQASRGWRSRNSVWFHRPEEDDPTHEIRVWSKEPGPAQLEIRDGDDRLLRSVDVELLAGVNQVEWDLRLDSELALAAEATRVAEDENEVEESAETTETTETTETSTTDERAALARVPWSEAVRLGYPLYVTAGEYKVRIVRGEASAQNTVTVKAPPPLPPRTTGPLSRPGKLHP